jgi:hypothetical protein
MKQLQVITLILIQMVAGAQAQNVDQAKKLFQAKQDSVIWVTGVATLSFTASDSRDAGMTPPDEEVKVESLATLVDASGVAVAVLSQLDPARNMNNRPLRTSRGPMKLETTATLKDLKLVLADGSEILADIVLKDEDLDLAFVRARAEGGNTNGVVFPALNLKDSVTANVLDEAISITRLDETFNRAPNVFASHINMATRKPRRGQTHRHHLGALDQGEASGGGDRPGNRNPGGVGADQIQQAVVRSRFNQCFYQAVMREQTHSAAK